MSFVLTKYQKQELGSAIKLGGYEPNEFVYTEDLDGQDSNSSATLTSRNTPDYFTVTVIADDKYGIARLTPGTARVEHYGNLTWANVTAFLTSWVRKVKRESEAQDPWEQEAEDMANDDSYFGIEELPRVDKAIEDSLDELKDRALEHGLSLSRIGIELQEAKKLLKKSARTSTKKEWLSLFKGIIVEKLVDWGMQTQVFQGVLQTLITSAHDIAQLAEHASRHLLA